MRFEWDEAKRRVNLRLHAIDFVAVESEDVFGKETLTRIDNRFEYGETRYITLGVLKGQVIAIVHTESSELIRIISVRKASKNEADLYFKEFTRA